MGHTASVQRSRHAANGTLYGEPAGATGAARGSYTPAQMQALYLSRGRPDMGFMSNQMQLPVDLPEMQQTCTVKNHVNLKKSSLKLQPLTKDPGYYTLSFQLDATKAFKLSLFLVAQETIDAQTGCSSFALVHGASKTPVLTQELPAGLGQLFRSTGEHEDGHDTPLQNADDQQKSTSLPCLDLSLYEEAELTYADNSLQFPLVILLEVTAEKGKKLNPQSQATFCTFVKKPNGSWDVKMLKQKILVDGLTYELQEIYGIDGSVAAAPKHQHANDSSEQTNHSSSPDAADTKISTKDELELPDDAECIICLSEPRSTTVLPCRHMCLCNECAETLRQSASTCPICRTPVEALLQIRVGNKEAESEVDD